MSTLKHHLFDILGDKFNNVDTFIDIFNIGESVKLYTKSEEVDDAVKHLGSRGLLFIITITKDENIERIMEC